MFSTKWLSIEPEPIADYQLKLYVRVVNVGIMGHNSDIIQQIKDGASQNIYRSTINSVTNSQSTQQNINALRNPFPKILEFSICPPLVGPFCPEISEHSNRC